MLVTPYYAVDLGNSGRQPDARDLHRSPDAMRIACPVGTRAVVEGLLLLTDYW